MEDKELNNVVPQVTEDLPAEENPVEVEAAIRHTITQATAERAGLSVEIKRLLLANAKVDLLSAY